MTDNEATRGPLNAHKRILVVEDSLVQAEMMLRLLERQDFDVFIAHDGIQALEVLGRQTMDMVITDVNMPRMNGIQLCEAIRQDNQLRDLKVIIVTMLSDPQDVLSSISAGADQYIVKPYTEEHLLQQIADEFKRPVYQGEQGDWIETDLQLGNESYHVKARAPQLLKLMLSTYENAIQQNSELLEAQLDIRELNLSLTEKLDELSRSQKQLQMNKERLQSIFTLVPDVIYRIDEQGRFEFINDAVRTYGWRPEDLIGQHFEILLPEDEIARVSRDKVIKRYSGKVTGDDQAPKLFDERRHEQGRITKDLEVKIRVKNTDKRCNGEIFTFWGGVNSAGYYDVNNSQVFLGTIGIIRDITERKCHELALKELNEALEDKVEKRTRELYQANQNLEKSLQEIASYRDHLQELVDNRTQALLEARDKAEAATRAKSDFLANVSHEIRTPLNAIIGMSHLLNNTSMTDMQKQQLGKIQKASHHLLNLINDILDLAKMEANKLQLEQTCINLAELVENIVLMLVEQAKQKGIELRVEVPELPLILGDSTRLTQSLLNLVGNAIKFTSEGSVTIRLSVENDQADSVQLLFEVIDTGMGIPEDKLAAIFDAFEQADSSTTRKFGGTGLGLAVVKMITDAMSGEIGVNSEIDQGSRFWFRILAIKASQKDMLKEDSRYIEGAEVILQERFRGHRVLLVEDDETNQDVSTGLLQAVGLDVDVVENGALAVEKLHNGDQYDVILMDMQMPVMGGVEATQKIRQLKWGNNTPILAMTANAQNESQSNCLEAGMNDFISKPVEPEALYSTLLRWLDTDFRTEVKSKVALPSTSKPLTEINSVQALKKPQNFRATNGFDSEIGLRATKGDINQLMLLLKQFSERHLLSVDRMLILTEQMEQGEDLSSALTELTRLAHTIKGGAATLGFSVVQIIATELEVALKDRSTALTHEQSDEMIHALTEASRKKIHMMKAALREMHDVLVLVTEGDLDEPAVIDPDNAEALLKQLHHYLIDSDAAAVKLLDDNRKLIKGIAGDDGSQLEHLIDSFDFTKAILLVESIGQQLEKKHS